MGRYIDDILQPGEKVLYSTNAHWIFYLPAIAAWIAAAVLLVLSRATSTEGIVLLCLSASAVVALAALYWTVKAWFHRWTTETDVTNMRVVHKTGFIKRRTFEMSLDKVESVDVRPPQQHHRAIGATRKPWPCNQIRQPVFPAQIHPARRPRRSIRRK